MTELSTLILEEARSQIGQKENPLGSNWGHPVKDYLASVGINFPASWCMAFVYWCFNEALKKSGVNNPLVKTGGVLNQWFHISGKYKSTKPVPGSIFIMDFGGGLGHTGIVESVVGNDLHTIDGNTNDTGGREGIEVCRRVRPISKCKGFINII